jgi:hypothetical protein
MRLDEVLTIINEELRPEAAEHFARTFAARCASTENDGGAFPNLSALVMTIGLDEDTARRMASDMALTHRITTTVH